MSWIEEWNKKVSEAKLVHTKENRRILFFAVKDYIFIARNTKDDNKREEAKQKALKLIDEYDFYDYLDEDDLSTIGIYININAK